MSTREEIEQQIEQAKAELTSSQTALTSAMEGTRQMASEEGGRGHEGIANSYLAAVGKLEEATNQTASALMCVEEGMTFVQQTRGLTANNAPSGTSQTIESSARGTPRRIAGPAGKRTLKPPNKRHHLNRIRGGSRSRNANTIILPGTDIDSDLRAIQEGKAHWNASDDRYEINGRRYGIEPKGTVFPESGSGLVQLSRSEYKALQEMIRVKGHKEKLSPTLTRNPAITKETWKKVTDLYRHQRRTNE